MYKHNCSMIEDEVVELQVQLRKARANISGLVKMNDLLATGKASSEAALRQALDRISAMIDEAPDNASFCPIDLVASQRDYLLRENQRLLAELKKFTAQPE